LRGETHRQVVRSRGRQLMLATAAITALGLAGLVGASACGAAPGGAAPAPERNVVRPGGARAAAKRRAAVYLPSGRVIAAEIADTPARLEEGYMFRREVGADDGMIFVFPDSGLHAFWMKNTLVPLDMIWMDDAFAVVYVQAMAPPCSSDPCATYGPPRKARYVLELQGGSAAREGLKIGDRLRIAFPTGAS
jgi:uncharacterized protein